MTWEILADRSGLSRATVQRLLSGEHLNASFLHVTAIAEALGVKVDFSPVPVRQFVEEQADRQARRLVGLVQGTMGLESQAVEQEHVSQMVRDTFLQLLGGPRKKLWVV
jgi:transcriptional regulator with XRE-family HTH domain